MTVTVWFTFTLVRLYVMDPATRPSSTCASASYKQQMLEGARAAQLSVDPELLVFALRN